MVEEYMMELGYSSEDIEYIVNSYWLKPYLEESLYLKVKVIYNYFLELGVSRKDIINMTRKYPSIYSYKIEKLDKKNKMFFEFGITKEDFIKQIMIMPYIYGLSVENIKVKKAFYEKIGIFDMIIKELKYLLCSIDLVYARYMFYRTIGIKINKSNYRKLFIRESYFINMYGKNNKTLIELYNFNEFVNKNKVKNRDSK